MFISVTIGILYFCVYFPRSGVKMPPVLLEVYEKNSTLDYRSPSLTNLTADQLADLLQWSDMVIFDYLTGNYDR